MKTENLVIMITDIVGFTRRTSKQSRKENADLLARHNSLLRPVIKSTGGKLVKAMGDAMLIVFSSPTDSLLCAMAMQDILFGYNRTVSKRKRIHIRIAVNIGEVRVVRSDIFGEPVNITSRIEGITPEDEIYFSDAVYLVMNKAEIPSAEVGFKPLKGIKEPVKIWQIPRFATSRLVVDDAPEPDDTDEICFPYGGAHHIIKNIENKGLLKSFAKPAQPVMTWVILVLAVLLSVFIIWFVSQEPVQVEPIPPADTPIEVIEGATPEDDQAEEGDSETVDPQHNSDDGPVPDDHSNGFE